MIVFFFKQKTAYEMRISDWSSDVCSSDLRGARTGVDLADPRIGIARVGADGRQGGRTRGELDLEAVHLRFAAIGLQSDAVQQRVDLDVLPVNVVDRGAGR